MEFNEKQIQNKLILLSSHIKGIKLIQEFSVPNIEEVNKSRRFDVIQIFNNYVLVIEIKKNTIDLETVSITLGDKNYIELAKKFFNKEIYFIFTSPKDKGISPKANNLIKLIPNVNYLDIESIFNNLYLEYVNQLPKEAKWRSKKIYEEFSPFITIHPNSLNLQL
jgi:hypothetical protein